ncbi:MAG: class I SAM-dependent methyltransferase [Thermofilaceae archaeon]|nr:class I SAM-dependent methyltransferase [Thermofilaceae archaeon]MCX8180992.1 class I SAM-dependent methyltransferase [Thermofilaceae archaeon]MDW8004097.1 class I SAM-dependent methyltransferase [Thermofilaceae archaeon]
MALSSFMIRKILGNPREALRVLRVSNELSRYIVWRLYLTLDENGFLGMLQEQPWWKFADRDLARWVCDILVEEGYAKWMGDTIKVTGKPEHPTITTKEAADLVPVIERAMASIPKVLLTGEKPNLAAERAAYAKVIGNLAYRLMIEVTVKETGLNELNENNVIVDVLSRIGTSTMVLLETTRARIISVDPYRDNILVQEHALKVAGQADRVKLIQSAPEELELPEKADAVFMADILHWTPNPRLALNRAHKCILEDGFLSMIQSTYSSAGLVTCLPDYLLGAYRAPPTSRELRESLRNSGFKIEKWTEAFGIVIVKAKPV